MVTIALCNKDTQPSQTCSEGYTFSATALSTQSRRLVRRNDASWSKFASAKAAHVLFFGASVTTVCLFFFVIGRVLTS